MRSVFVAAGALLLASLCLLLLAPLSFGQGANATITGTVTDPTGLVVPGRTWKPPTPKLERFIPDHRSARASMRSRIWRSALMYWPLHRIGRPYALKIPARRAEYSLTESALALHFMLNQHSFRLDSSVRSRSSSGGRTSRISVPISSQAPFPNE